MNRHTENLKLSLFYLLCLLAVLIVFMWTTGCADHAQTRQVKGAFDDEQTERLAVEIANKYRWGWTRIDNRDKSMGDYLSDHAIAWYWTDYNSLRVGMLVIARVNRDKVVIHQIKAGNPQTGFSLQGYENNLPDNFLMTENNYIGTYIGNLTGSGQ